MYSLLIRSLIDNLDNRFSFIGPSQEFTNAGFLCAGKTRRNLNLSEQSRQPAKSTHIRRNGWNQSCVQRCATPNRPFPSSCPPLQSESKCEVFLMKISFHSYVK